MKTFKLFFLISFFAIYFFVWQNIFANDSFVRTAAGGSFSVMKTEHPSIKMETELIEMYLYDGYYLVTAAFDFTNFGDSTTVLMGFPENRNDIYFNYYKYLDVNDSSKTEDCYPGFWDGKYHSSFLYIKSFVDGAEAKLEQHFAKVEGDDNESGGYFYYHPYWIKSVRFEKNKKRKVIVKYACRYPDYWECDGDMIKKVEYNFTGGNWLNKVRYSKLVVSPKVNFSPCKSKLDSVSVENGNYIFEKNDWEAEYNFTFGGSINSEQSGFEFSDDKILEVNCVNRSDSNNSFIGNFAIKDFDGRELYKSKNIFGFNNTYSPSVFYLSNNTFGVYFYNNMFGSFYYIDLNKAFEPLYAINNVEAYSLYEDESQDFEYLVCTATDDYGLGKKYFYYSVHLLDNIYIVQNPESEKFSKEEEYKETRYKKDFVADCENNANDYKNYILNNYDKPELKDEYSNESNLFQSYMKAYILQLIFIGKEKEAFEFFDKYFPFPNSKENIRDRVFQIKQEILDFKYTSSITYY